MRPTLAAAVAVAALPLLPAPVALAADSVPYHDGHVAGALAFCDAHGHNLTSGVLKDAPIGPKVVSDFVPPDGYDGNGAGAALLGFQPREGVDPANWSGEQMTATSTYTDPKHPSAEMLPGDVSLLQVSQDFPPRWAGLLQLRMYYTSSQGPVYRMKYAAMDVRIEGSRWSVVNPIAISCTTGRATSVARALGIPTTAPTGGVPSRRPTPPTAVAPSATPSGAASALPSATAAAGSSTSKSSSNGALTGLLAGVGAAVLIAVVAVLGRRRAAAV